MVSTYTDTKGHLRGRLFGSEGEGVAEAVDVGVGDASAPAQAADEKAKGMKIERVAFPGDEQWIIRAGYVFDDVLFD